MVIEQYFPIYILFIPRIGLGTGVNVHVNVCRYVSYNCLAINTGYYILSFCPKSDGRCYILLYHRKDEQYRKKMAGLVNCMWHLSAILIGFLF